MALANQILKTCMQAKDGIRSCAHWKRSWRPDSTWVHQICQETGVTASKALRLAECRWFWRTMTMANATAEWYTPTCCCCHDEPIRHCLYGGQRGPEEMRNSTKLWFWRDPSLPCGSWQPFINWGTTQGRLSLPTADVLSTIVKQSMLTMSTNCQAAVGSPTL